METSARYFWIGLVVMILCVCSISFVLWISKGAFEGPTSFCDIEFEGSVTGLKEGAPVLYQGVPVGSVRSIRLNEVSDNHVVVHVGFTKTVTLRDDTLATLEMQGLTGVAFVQLKPQNSDSPILTPGPQGYPVVKGQPSRLEALFESAPKLLENINELVQHLDGFLNDHNQKNMRQLLGNLNKISDKFVQRFDRIDTVIEEGTQALKDISQTAQAYRELAVGLEDDLKPMLREAHLFLSQNREPLHIFLTSGLYAFSSALAELRKTLSSINRVTTDVERDPWHFLFGTPDQGYVLP